jgi:UDP-N-acetylmuramate--alanine ligase
VVCVDDEEAAALARAAGPDSHIVTYGTSEGATYRMVDVERSGRGVRFAVVRGGDRVADIRLPISGLHNARNACAALAASTELGVPTASTVRALERFGGVARHFEHRGEVAGVTFIDDYAHLPTEVAAAISAARDGEWHRIVCAFQPHRYSRTAALWADFADAFVGVDVLVVTDIYAAGETPRPGVSGKLIVQAVLDSHPRCRVVYLPHRADLVSFLTGELKAGDLCLTLGAGDLTTVPDDLRIRLSAG